MSYVVCREKGIRLDLMAKKKFWPKMVGHIQRAECTYAEEKEIRIGGVDWILVKDIQSKYGYETGALLGLFYGLEWENLQKGEDEKFYILLSTDGKGARKRVHKARKKAHDGRQGRTAGEPAGDIQPGETAGPGGEGDWPGDPGPDAVWGIEGLEIPDGCDQ